MSNGDIVVTANKRTERLLDVPAPVTAVSAEDLARTHANKLEDLAAHTAGLNLATTRPGETQIILRGITTGSPISSTVATYIDDTAFGSSTTQALAGYLSPDLDPSDIKRIEILRGPQGTLYGASSLGGLVKYVTEEPDLKKMHGRVEAGVNGVSKGGTGFDFRGMVNLPVVSDMLALRVSGYKRRDAGFIDDTQQAKSDVNRADTEGGRAALLFRPSDHFSVELTATLQNLEGQGTSDEDVTVTGASLAATHGDLTHVRYTPEPLKLRSRLYSGTIAYDLDFARLVSITSYSTLRQVATTDQTSQLGPTLSGLLGVPGVGFSVGSDLNLRKWTEEARVESHANTTLEWRLGFYYTHETTARLEPSSTFLYATQTKVLPDNTIFFANLYSHYTEYAGFGDLTWHISPRFDLSAGLRHSGNSQDFSETSGGLAVGATSTVGQTSSDKSTTFQVSSKFKLDPDSILYARIASGYRPGGPNAVTPAQTAAGVPSQYRPDTLTSYDIGYKAALFHHAVTLDLSAFYISWQDIQLLTRFGGFTSAGNGGTARSQGVEVSATWIPVSGLHLSGNASYTDATLTENATGVNGHNGDRLPNVPKWAGALSADYDFTLGSGVSAYVGGGVHAVGARRAGFVSGSPASYVRPTLPAYATVDLRAGVDLKNFSVSVYAKNIGDKRAFNYIASLNNSAYLAPYSATVIQPRTIGATFSAKF
ncbi:TonB-dependent receptor [Sphingomonas sp. RT2P30]|uniref:TonB-dependent receptor n=1 Tax=Parasphingomonas halimpatiens TaxID=3096162 RepID=UPI002FC6C4EE